MRPGVTVLRFLHLLPSEASFSRVASHTRIEHELFNGGPPARLETLTGIMRAGHPNIGLRAGLVLVLGWVTLAALVAIQERVFHDGSFRSFIVDYSVHARSLIAAPLLIAAEGICLPRLSEIVTHFAASGIVAPRDHRRFEEIVQSTLRMRDSLWVELAILVLVVILVTAFAAQIPQTAFPAWHRVGVTGGIRTSAAGLWHNFISVPILLLLLFGWTWRLCLWARFLFLVSRLRLQLVAAHPDRAGGLRFAGISAQAFSVLAFSLSVIVAGLAANRVVHNAAPLLSFKYAVIGLNFLIIVAFMGPLLVFCPQLFSAWKRGVFEYGALARGIGLQLEHKWLSRSVGEKALAASDFSATTDLYSVTANVYAMNILPLSLTNAAVLVVATLLPFIPVVLMSVSPEVIFHKLAGVLL